MPRALKICSHPTCPTIVATARCPEHTRAADRARGTRQQRGYDRTHELIRAELLKRFVPGIPCPKCGQPMLEGQRLEAGHSRDLRFDRNAKADRLEHESCNRGWRKGGS